MYSVDTVIIGAGVIGLAIARKLALLGQEVVVVEKEACFGSITSSRNSEVIHAGIYYPPGSLKARLCARGREQLYDYCRQYNIAHRACGKLIVATDECQLPALEGICQNASRNGVDNLQYLSRTEAGDLEPELSCCGALLSPSTGIIDSHGFMLSLLGQAETAGAVIAYRTRIEHLQPSASGILIHTDEGPLLCARNAINAAGLDAPAIAARTKGLGSSFIPGVYYAKGNYFTLATRSPFSRLIYPVPEAGGLGIHLTLDLGGQARFGPDVEWVEAPDYGVSAKRSAAFYRHIRAYWPGLPDESLLPGYAGVRPKLSGPGAPPADFRIDGPSTHGIDGLVNLFGIESPGLTASLAIADHVAGLIEAVR